MKPFISLVIALFLVSISARESVYGQAKPQVNSLPVIKFEQDGPASAKFVMPEHVESFEDAQFVFHNYYRAANPELLVPVLRSYISSGDLKNFGALPPVCAFVSRIFAQFPQRIPAWVKALEPMPAFARDNLLLVALEWTDCREARDAASILERDGAVLPAGLPLVNLDASSLSTDFVITSASHIDMLWGAFWATGDRRYVEKIIAITPWAKEGVAPQVLSSRSMVEKSKDNSLLAQIEREFLGQDNEEREDVLKAQEEAKSRIAMTKRVLGETAIWSLSANARKHSLVRSICRDAMKANSMYAASLGHVIGDEAAPAPNQ